MFKLSCLRSLIDHLASGHQITTWFIGKIEGLHLCLSFSKIYAQGRFMESMCKFISEYWWSSPLNTFSSGRDRFLNFHGQHGVRLSSKQSIHIRDQKLPRSFLFKILSPILFSAPNVHLKTMTGIWPDKLTLKAPWIEFFTELSDEWQGHTVFVGILGSIPYFSPIYHNSLSGLYSPDSQCCLPSHSFEWQQ